MITLTLNHAMMYHTLIMNSLSPGSIS